MINGAKLMVTVLMDNAKVEEMKAQGYSDLDIQKTICKAITLTDANVRQPVWDIESVELIKYY